MRRATALLAAVLLASCGGGGDSADPPPRTTTGESPPAAAAAPTRYVAEMRAIVTSVGRALRGADLDRRRDFDRGVAFLRARRAMARITADPGLLLAHDRLAQALAQGGTLLVSAPGSPYEKAARRAGRPLGVRGAVAPVALALGAWAFETGERLPSRPAWLRRARTVAERVTRRAAS